MQPPHSRQSRRNNLLGIATSLAILVMVVVILRSASEVLIPICLAILTSFLLNPLVDRLQRVRVPRAVAVVIVVITVFGALAFPAKHMISEMTALAEDLPRYRDTIRERIRSIRSLGQGNVMDRLEEVANVVEEEANSNSKSGGKDKGKAADRASSDATVATDASGSSAASRGEQDQKGAGEAEPEPVPVVMKPDEPIATRALMWAMAPLGNFLATFGATAVLTFFLLLRHSEMRYRAIALAGLQRMTIVTRIFDEAGTRVGNYLLTQATINGSYGVLLGVGLHLLGLPYAPLWGMLGFFFRFVPYIGPILVSTLPIALSLIVFDDWMHPLGVVAFVAGLELVTNMVLEPIFYGRSVGMSDVAILVAVMLFTWLWGPVGMIIATPMTVCLVVFCKYIPGLEWVSALAGDEPAIQPPIVFYQRLIAHDEKEAGTILRHSKREHGVVSTLDKIVLPALALSRRELAMDRLTKQEAEEIATTIQRLADDFLSPEPDAAADAGAADTETSAGKPPESPPEAGKETKAAALLVWPLEPGGDDVAAKLLRQLSGSATDLEFLSSKCLMSEFYARIEASAPDAVLVCDTEPDEPPSSKRHVQRLNDRFPNLKIFVGRWGVPEDQAGVAELAAVGATAVFTTFERTLGMLSQLRQTEDDQ